MLCGLESDPLFILIRAIHLQQRQREDGAEVARDEWSAVAENTSGHCFMELFESAYRESHETIQNLLTVYGISACTVEGIGCSRTRLYPVLLGSASMLWAEH